MPLNSSARIISSIAPFGCDQLRSLAVGADGVVWAATNYSGWGVVTFDGNDFTRYAVEDSLSGGKVRQVAVAADGKIWAATDALYDHPSTASPTEAAGIVSFDDRVWQGFPGRQPNDC